MTNSTLDLDPRRVLKLSLNAAWMISDSWRPFEDYGSCVLLATPASKMRHIEGGGMYVHIEGGLSVYREGFIPL